MKRSAGKRDASCSATYLVEIEGKLIEQMLTREVKKAVRLILTYPVVTRADTKKIKQRMNTVKMNVLKTITGGTLK